MADRVEIFRVTVPAGTAQAAPADTPLSFNPGNVTDIELVIPTGPSGLVGFKIRHSGNTIIPYGDNTFVVTDGEIIRWPLTGAPVGNKWVFRAYNTDIYDHTIEVRFLVTETRNATVAPVPSIEIAPIAPAEIEPTAEEVA